MRLKLILCFFIFLWMEPVALFASSPYDYYEKGIKSNTLLGRRKAFEQSLELYLKILQKIKKKGGGNAYLLYNIGNCYYNLNQIGYAIFYYKKALSLPVQNKKIISNLKEALKKRKNFIDVTPGIIEKNLFFFHYSFSTSLRLDLLLIFSILTSCSLILLSFLPRTSLKICTSIFIILTILFSLSLGKDYYFPDHVGIIVKECDIRKDKDFHFAPLTKRPLGEGSSLRVLNLDGKWYKVKLNDGRTGYIYNEYLKLLK